MSNKNINNEFVVVHPKKSFGGDYWEALYWNEKLMLAKRGCISLYDALCHIIPSNGFDDFSTTIYSPTKIRYYCADILDFADFNDVPKTLGGMDRLINSMWESIRSGE